LRAELGHFGKHFIKILTGFEMWCWRRTDKIDGPIAREMKKYYKQSRRIGISLIQKKRRKANWFGHFLRRNCLLKHVIERYKGQEDEGEDVSSYWMTLKMLLMLLPLMMMLIYLIMPSVYETSSNSWMNGD
jgi:hypothetical protein